MVREQFNVEPDPWQVEDLEAFPNTNRLALKAAKGPGKSTVLSWIGWNYLLTRPHPKIGAVSVSATNLADGLWSEMAKWMNCSPLLKAKFEWTKTRIFSKDYPETWFMSAKSYPKTADANQQANTLAGFHADYVLFLMDETGDMPRAVAVTAEAALAGCKEAHIVQAGNPTSREGALYYCCQVARHLWTVITVTGDPDDPNRSNRISIDYARDLIKLHGRDNAWVKCNIFGEFPPTSINSLIGDDDVEAAMKRYHREFEIGNAPKVMGVDVAREGDDASVIFCRQGIQSFAPLSYRNIDSTQGAGVVSRKWADWGADAAFIDATGGFGSGWIDQLRLLGKSPIGVQFAGEAHDKSRYANKRAEMYFDAVEWIKRGGALPNSPELLAELTQTTYTHKGDRLLLEPKDQIKIKLGRSPDIADAFALTFAEPIQSATRSRSLPNRSAVTKGEYNPFADMDLESDVQRSYGAEQ